MRINGFEQIKAFYSWVFNEPEKARPSHISLYLFLLNQNNRANWVEWFKCPYDLAMHGARIGSKSTYYNCLNDLKKWEIIDYQKGQNNFKAPLIKLFVLYKSVPLTEQVTVPLSEPQTEPQCVPLPVPLTGKKYKLLTDNIELITNNIDAVVDFVNGFEDSKKKTTWRDDFNIYKNELREVYLDLINDEEYISLQEKYRPNLDIKLSLEKACMLYWATEAGWKQKKSKKSKTIDWKQTLTNALDMNSNKVYKNRN